MTQQQAAPEPTDDPLNRPERVYAKYCVILAMTRPDPRWIEAIETSIGGLGLTLVRHRSGERLNIEHGDATLVVVEDLKSLDDLGIHEFVVIASDLPRVVGAGEEPSKPEALRRLSELLAWCGALPAAQTTFYSRADALEGRREITTPGGLRLMAPDSEAEPDGPLNMYRTGKPEIGQGADWPPEIFVYGRKKAKGRGVEIDLTGPPGLVVSGPHLYLPPGCWEVKAELIFDEGATRRKYRIEWGGLEQFESLDFYPEKAGVYALAMRHDFASVNFAELRIVLLDSTIDGMIAFSGAKVRRIA